MIEERKRPEDQDDDVQIDTVGPSGHGANEGNGEPGQNENSDENDEPGGNDPKGDRPKDPPGIG